MSNDQESKGGAGVKRDFNLPPEDKTLARDASDADGATIKKGDIFTIAGLDKFQKAVNEAFETAEPFAGVERAHDSRNAEGSDHILQFFQNVQDDISKPFAELAFRIVQTVPRNPERTAALRKLLEAMDATIRAKFAKYYPT